MKNIEEISAEVVDAAFHMHKDLGPGLLESVYEVVLAKVLEKRGIFVERQKVIPIQYAGLRFDEGFRADLLVEGTLLVELKSVEHLAHVHSKQVITYLRLYSCQGAALCGDCGCAGPLRPDHFAGV